MTITQIQYFLTAAELRSFTKAASRLYVSQQAVSRQIQALEEELTFPLFLRVNRQVELTEEGEILFQMWKRQVEETEEVIRNARDGYRGRERIRVGIADMNQIVDEVLPVLLALKESGSPASAGWEYRIASFVDIGQSLADGECDVAMTLLTELPDDFPQDQILELRQVWPMVFLGKSHPLYSRKLRSLEELREALNPDRTGTGRIPANTGTFLVMESSWSAGSAARTAKLLAEAGIRPAGIRRFSNPDELELELITGNGILIDYEICLHARYASSLWHFPAEHMREEHRSALALVWRDPQMKRYAEQICSLLPGRSER